MNRYYCADATPKPVSFQVIQQGGEIGNGRDRDPAQIDADGQERKPGLSSRDRGLSDTQAQIGDNQRSKQAQHGNQG